MGDWYILPQALVPLGRAEDDKHRPWIVAGSGSGILKAPVVPRSTKEGYGGFYHPAHHGKCGIPLCNINRPGWIGGTFQGHVSDNVDFYVFTAERRSCYEPDQEVIEEVMVREARDRRAAVSPRRRGSG